MSHPDPPACNNDEAIRQIAGYLNFSSGARDLRTLSNLDFLCRPEQVTDPLFGQAAWITLGDRLTAVLNRLEGTSAAFVSVEQARAVVGLVWGDLLPAYLNFHSDLLFHQPTEVLFNGFFIGQCIEAVLQQGGPWEEVDRIVPAAIAQLNSYVGYRPLATLENKRCHIYPHEWIAPISLYIDGVGVASGRYHEVVTRALKILRETDDSIKRAAHFDIDLMTELAYDPRAYDFDHPVNRRPNYHFGTWDPHAIDGQGRYRRFIVQQVTLDALLSRTREVTDLPKDELFDEAAAVLAGTILMASGISGWGPSAHPSTVTLASLCPDIARYRDAFYESLLRNVRGAHGKRLQSEALVRHQAYGAARQHLNASLSRQRAKQLQHVHLARLYARMGFPEAAKRQTDVVHVTYARLESRIDCAITEGTRALLKGDLKAAAAVPEMVMDFVRRGIDCGAMADPWNILGFAGNFSLFPGPESSMHDHRIDEFVALMEQLFGYTARVWSEAAAVDDQQCFEQLDRQFRDAAMWWRQFAAHQIADLEAIDPLESYESAKLVATALRVWHRGGASAGDVKFWAPHAQAFDSPRAYALVIGALLEREDFVASMALLMHWLGNAGEVGLERGNSSFPRIAERWLARLRQTARRGDRDKPGATRPWELVCKFFDFMEANAEEFWQPPQFALGHQANRPRDWDRELEAADTLEDDDDLEDGDEQNDLFNAAYENVTYQDTTDDGYDGSVFDEGGDTQDELEAESRRLSEHLSFLTSLARLWVIAADFRKIAHAEAEEQQDDQLVKRRIELMALWSQHAASNRAKLLELLEAVQLYRIPTGGADDDSMSTYDRRRMVRDSLIERIISTAVETSDARRVLTGSLGAEPGGAEVALRLMDKMSDDDQQVVRMFSALIDGRSNDVKKQFPELLRAIQSKPLLYIPLARGGDPVKIFTTRLRRRMLTHLLQWLPRQGHLAMACRLIETARLMEHHNPVGPGAVTEFDALFGFGFRSLVQALVDAVRSWNGDQQDDPDDLIPLLEKLTETLLASWLDHSRTLRLSVLETATDGKSWRELVDFVKAYGDPIFTQAFLKLGNIRAILHQGVGDWLDRLIDDPDALAGTPLVEALGSRLSLDEAERHLTVVFESILDHHSEFRDYNSTTTQSDRGDLIYMFLDFLRLRVRYDRIAWNLRPVMWTHEILVRAGFDAAAASWRRSLSERIGTEAELYLDKLHNLQNKYAMRMPTVADRISERFIQPMTIDRMRALIKLAMEDADQQRESQAFELLDQETEHLTRTPAGSGLDLPNWLASLEDEVENVIAQREADEIDDRKLISITPSYPTAEELIEELETANRQARRLPHLG
ncbi:MAG: hypothetical protein R3C05_05925 [Pirellulaceae bacterium]